MFAMPISHSALVGSIADDMFPNIKGITFRRDVSFLVAERMLLYKRIPDEETATVYYEEFDLGDLMRIGSANQPEFLKAILNDDMKTENHVLVASCPVFSDGDKKTLNEMFKDVEEINGMKREPAVEAFFGQIMNAHVYSDFATARTLIVTDRMSVAKWHAIASLTSRYFHKFFEEKPLTPDERQISFALCDEKTPDKFIDMMRDFAKQFDFRSATIKSSLAGFESKNARIRLSRLDDQLEGKRRQIEDQNREYVRLMREKRSLEDSRAALALGLTEDKNEMMNYFLTNKNLILNDVDEEGSLTFSVKTPFANFNPDLAEKMITNPERRDRVDMYRRGSSDVSMEDRDLLFRAILLDRKVRVWLYGKFTIGLDRSYAVEAHSDVDQTEELADTCPNPHLYFHACMGDNQRAAIDALLSGDYILSVEQCIGSVASVNLAETVTSGPWMELLLSDKYGRFFELEDGRRMNFTEVMKYLKEEDK